MSEFTSQEWALIRKELTNNPAGYGMPQRVDKSALVASFNIRKLGRLRQAGDDGGRDDTTMKFLSDICKPFDLLAIQEVLPEMEAVRKLKELTARGESPVS